MAGAFAGGGVRCEIGGVVAVRDFALVDRAGEPG